MIKALTLIYFISQKLIDMGQKVDKLKIYKLMYFIDFEFYSQYKKSISEQFYYNCEYGPVPSANQQNYRKDNLLDKGIIEKLWTIEDNIIKIDSKKALKLSGFNLAENEVIDQIMDTYGKLKSFDLVSLSHQDMPWKMTENGEIIDYDYVFWRETKQSYTKNITEQIINI